MSETGLKTLMDDIGLPEIKILQESHDEQSREVVKIGGEEGEKLGEVRARFIAEKPETNPTNLKNKELIEVYTDLLKQLEEMVKELENNPEAGASDSEIIKQGIAKMVEKLRSDEKKSGLNKMDFEGLADTIDRHVAITGDSDLSMVWLPRKIRREIEPALEDAKETLVKSDKVPKMINDFRELISGVLALAESLESKFKEVFESGKENSKKLLRLNPVVDFLAGLKNQFDALVPEADLLEEQKRIEAEVKKEFEVKHQAVLMSNKKTAVGNYASQNDDMVRLEQGKEVGKADALNIEEEAEITRRIQQRKADIAKGKGFPEAWIKLQQELSAVTKKRNDLLLLVETQSILVNNIRVALGKLKRKKDSSAPEEEKIKDMVETLVRQDIKFGEAIPSFRAVGYKGAITGLKPDDAPNLAASFGVPGGEVMKINTEATAKIQAHAEAMKKTDAEAAPVQAAEATEAVEAPTEVDDPSATKAPGYIPPVETKVEEAPTPDPETEEPEVQGPTEAAPTDEEEPAEEPASSEPEATEAAPAPTNGGAPAEAKKPEEKKPEDKKAKPADAPSA